MPLPARWWRWRWRSAIWSAAEAVAWGLALAAKLYTWPLAIALPFFWKQQRASRLRILAVVAACAIAAGLTFADLSSRAQNPLGVVAFDRPGGAPLSADVDVVELVKVTIASAAWASGEHWDALRPLGFALYVLPILFVLRPRRTALVAAVLLAFALAQSVNVLGCVLARRAGSDVPIGGKEGWYWFVLAPILVPALLAPAVKRFPWIAWWIVAWDVVITDAQLFHTWAGQLSPDRPSLLFRWGPLHAPFVKGWRIAHVALFAALQRSARDA